MTNRAEAEGGASARVHPAQVGQLIGALLSATERCAAGLPPAEIARAYAAALGTLLGPTLPIGAAGDLGRWVGGLVEDAAALNERGAGTR